MGVSIEDPHWIELDNEADMEQLEEELQFYMTGSGQNRFPKMIVSILGNESIYEKQK